MQTNSNLEKDYTQTINKKVMDWIAYKETWTSLIII